MDVVDSPFWAIYNTFTMPENNNLWKSQQCRLNNGFARLTNVPAGQVTVTLNN
jgi:hypothetical protein